MVAHGHSGYRLSRADSARQPSPTAPPTTTACGASTWSAEPAPSRRWPMRSTPCRVPAGTHAYGTSSGDQSFRSGAPGHRGHLRRRTRPSRRHGGRTTTTLPCMAAPASPSPPPGFTPSASAAANGSPSACRDRYGKTSAANSASILRIARPSYSLPEQFREQRHPERIRFPRRGEPSRRLP